MSESKKTVDAAPTIDIAPWVKVNDFKLTDEAKKLFEWFVLGTPAIGVSQRSSGFIEYAHVNTTLTAEALFAALQKNGPAICVYDSSAELRTEISKIQKLNTTFWFTGECAHMVKGDNDGAKNEIKKLSDFILASNSALKKEQTSIVHRRFLNIDTLFRHIRNALAHGCYFQFCLDSQPYFFLFDLNQYGELSAVFSLSYSRLLDWHKQIERLAHV